MGKQFKIFVQGLIITAPAILTLYVCISAVLWLDASMQAGLLKIGLPKIPGLGVVIALAAIYMVGLLARTWLFQQLIHLAESLLGRIPLIKSLYSAVKDMLQFFGGGDVESRGVPARVDMENGRFHLLGLVTQKNPEKFMGEREKGRVAVYLPMSYQIGGFTVFVNPDQIEEIHEMTVEDVLKLTLTAGVGSTGKEGDSEK